MHSPVSILECSQKIFIHRRGENLNYTQYCQQIDKMKISLAKLSKTFIPKLTFIQVNRSVIEPLFVVARVIVNDNSRS